MKYKQNILIVFGLLMTFMCSCILPCNAAQTVEVINDGSQIIIKVNGNQLNFDQQPYISNGRTMVPFRAIAEALGAEVLWNALDQKIIIIGNNKVVELIIGSNVAKIDGSAVTLDTPAVIVGGRTMVPLRFVGESLGSEVSYKSEIVQLTADYWIPDLTKTYVYQDAGYLITKNWTLNNDGSYLVKISGKSDIYNTSYSSSEEYFIKEGHVFFKRDVGDGLANWIKSGQKAMIAPVTPGQTWENNYIEAIEAAGLYSCHDTCKFIGMEELYIMNKPVTTAHIQINTTREENDNFWTEDLWLMKNVGIVKSVNKGGTCVLIDIQ